MRGTFANVRLRNQLAPGTEGGVTVHLPDGEQTYHLRGRHALPRPRACRWWSWPARSTARARAATGRPRAPALLGVRAVIAESFERIHRSNLVGMGVLPLQFPAGESAGVLGLTGRETLLDQRPGRPQRRRRAQGGRGPSRRPRTVPSISFDVRVADRHADGGRVLPPRRHPAATCCASSPASERARPADSPGRQLARTTRNASASAPRAGRPPGPSPSTTRGASPRGAPSPTWLWCWRSAATFGRTSSVVSTATVGSGNAISHSSPRCGAPAPRRAARGGRRGCERRGRRRRRPPRRGQVVGVAGEDPVPVALGGLGDHPVGAELADHPAEVPAQLEAGGAPGRRGSRGR